jgi:hypothetical protein
MILARLHNAKVDMTMVAAAADRDSVTMHAAGQYVTITRTQIREMTRLMDEAREADRLADIAAADAAWEREQDEIEVAAEK